MKQEKIEIKSKNKVLETGTYDAPETLAEGIKVDGEEKVFKLYLMERKTRFMDSRRRVLTGSGVPTALTKALKQAKPEQLKKIIALLGDAANPDLVAGVAALIGDVAPAGPAGPSK